MPVIINDFEVVVEPPEEPTDAPTEAPSDQPSLKPDDIERIVIYFQERLARVLAD